MEWKIRQRSISVLARKKCWHPNCREWECCKKVWWDVWAPCLSRDLSLYELILVFRKPTFDASVCAKEKRRNNGKRGGNAWRLKIKQIFFRISAGHLHLIFSHGESDFPMSLIFPTGRRVCCWWPTHDFVHACLQRWMGINHQHHQCSHTKHSTRFEINKKQGAGRMIYAS